jgi:hypothetical protein
MVEYVRPLDRLSASARLDRLTPTWQKLRGSTEDKEDYHEREPFCQPARDRYETCSNLYFSMLAYIILGATCLSVCYIARYVWTAILYHWLFSPVQQLRGPNLNGFFHTNLYNVMEY